MGLNTKTSLMANGDCNEMNRYYCLTQRSCTDRYGSTYMSNLFLPLLLENFLQLLKKQVPAYRLFSLKKMDPILRYHRTFKMRIADE